MAKVKGERHEAYETTYRYTTIDFISAVADSPLRAQELSDDESDPLSIPPSGAEIWNEWHTEQEPGQERLLRQIDEVTRAMASSALLLVQMDELLA